MVEITNLIHFIETWSFDNKLYACVRNWEGDEEYDVFFKRGNQTGSKDWSIGIRNSGNLTQLSGSDVMTFCEEKDINVLELEHQLNSKVCTQIAFASKFLNEAKDLFGEGFVQKAEDDMNQFFNSLIKAIEQHIPNPKKPKLTVVKDD